MTYVKALLISLLTLSISVQASSNLNLVKSLIEDVWNNGQIEKIKDLVSENYTLYNDPGDPFNGQTIDHETYLKRIKQSKDLIPDLNFKIDELFEGTNNDKVVIKWQLRGTYQMKFPINIHGITIYLIEDDKIIGHIQVIDRSSP